MDVYSPRLFDLGVKCVIGKGDRNDEVCRAIERCGAVYLCAIGGAGALVPITGFANSVVSSAMEYKVEGQVFGIGCKIFTIAGPVILYGVLTSWGLGLLYWLFSLL